MPAIPPEEGAAYTPLSFDVECVVLGDLGPLCVLEFVHGVLTLRQTGRAARRLLLPTTQLRGGGERHKAHKAHTRKTKGIY